MSEKQIDEYYHEKGIITNEKKPKIETEYKELSIKKVLISKDFKTWLMEDEKFNLFVTTEQEKQHWLSLYEETIVNRILNDFSRWIKERILSNKYNKIEETKKKLEELKNELKRDAEQFEEDLW